MSPSLILQQKRPHLLRHCFSSTAVLCTIKWPTDPSPCAMTHTCQVHMEDHVTYVFTRFILAELQSGGTKGAEIPFFKSLFLNENILM